MLFEDSKKISVPKEFISSFTKPVTFRLLNTQGGMNVATGKIQFPVTFGILPFFTKRKTITGGGSQMVEVRYARTQRKNGDGEYEYSPSVLDFIKGQLTCDPKNHEHADILYILRNSPYCKKDSLKDSDGTTPLFYEVDNEKTALSEVDILTAKHNAEGLILSGWDEDQLREIAFAFGDLNAENKSKAQLQTYLSALATKDPVKFYAQATSEELELRSKISKGIALKVISERGGVWYWGVNAEREEKSEAEICRVRNSGEDPKSRLLAFFNKAIKSENVDYFLERLKAAQSVEA